MCQKPHLIQPDPSLISSERWRTGAERVQPVWYGSRLVNSAEAGRLVGAPSTRPTVTTPSSPSELEAEFQPYSWGPARCLYLCGLRCSSRSRFKKSCTSRSLP